MIAQDLMVFILFSLISVTLHQHSGQTSCHSTDWSSCNSACIRPQLEPLSSYPLLLPRNIFRLFTILGKTLLSNLNLQIFEDVHPSSTTEIGWRTGERILLQMKITKCYHKPSNTINYSVGLGWPFHTLIPLVD